MRHASFKVLAFLFSIQCLLVLSGHIAASDLPRQSERLALKKRTHHEITADASDDERKEGSGYGSDASACSNWSTSSQGVFRESFERFLQSEKVKQYKGKSKNKRLRIRQAYMEHILLIFESDFSSNKNDIRDSIMSAKTTVDVLPLLERLHQHAADAFPETLMEGAKGITMQNLGTYRHTMCDRVLRQWKEKTQGTDSIFAEIEIEQNYSGGFPVPRVRKNRTGCRPDIYIPRLKTVFDFKNLGAVMKKKQRDSFHKHIPGLRQVIAVCEDI